MSNHPLSVLVDVISLDIPFLVGKPTPEHYDLTVDVKGKQLKSPAGNIPLHDGCHLVVKWDNSDVQTHYTKGQIRKLHRHYLHPSTTKLYDLLRRADPNLSSATKDLIVDSVGLGDIRGCDECKELLESEQWLAL
jgi:hypothetical protein